MIAGMDRDARSRVYALALAQLQRWAHGRVPRTVRKMTDTADLVQDTFVEALKHFDGLDDIDRGALNAYLRGALKNRISDEMRRAHRRGSYRVDQGAHASCRGDARRRRSPASLIAARSGTKKAGLKACSHECVSAGSAS